MAPRGRARRQTATAADGWIYLKDAEGKYDLPRSTLHGWSLDLPKGYREKDEESLQVRVKESELRKLMKKKGRLIE